MIMARVKINLAPLGPKGLDAEIPRLRDLGAEDLRARWRIVFRKDAPAHIPRHLLRRTLAYRLQADALGDLDDESKQLLDRLGATEGSQNEKLVRPPTPTKIRQGTILAREWKGQMHRVAVLSGGFAWNGKTYPSLSKVAFEITGSRWNGPRFFGLRDKAATRPSAEL